MESGGDVNAVMDLRPEQTEALRRAIAHVVSTSSEDVECRCVDLPPPPAPSPPPAATSSQSWSAFAGAPALQFGMVSSTPMPQTRAKWSGGACALSPQPPPAASQSWKWSLPRQPSASTTVVAAPPVPPPMPPPIGAGVSFGMNTLPKVKAGANGGAIPKTFSSRKLRPRN